MAKQIVWTDHVFDMEKDAWDCVLENYSPEKNYIMRNAKKAGKKVAVGVRKRGRKYIVVIVIG